MRPLCFLINFILRKREEKRPQQRVLHQQPKAAAAMGTRTTGSRAMDMAGKNRMDMATALSLTGKRKNHQS